MYEVEITPEGLRHLDQLPTKVRSAVIETILGSIAENPQRAGKPLRGELEGLYSARRGEFRVIYEIDDEARIVLVHRAAPPPGVPLRLSGGPGDTDSGVDRAPGAGAAGLTPISVSRAARRFARSP